jgi:hypothetical protein
MFQRNHACDPPQFCTYDGCNSSGKKRKPPPENAGIRNGVTMAGMVGMLLPALALFFA